MNESQNPREEKSSPVGQETNKAGLTMFSFMALLISLAAVLLFRVVCIAPSNSDRAYQRSRQAILRTVCDGISNKVSNYKD